VRIIDKLPAPTTESRAIVVHARSLEMLDRIGLAEQFMAAGLRTTELQMHVGGETLARLDLSVVASPFPFTITIAQTETERILTEFLAGLGVTPERGAELTGLEQDACQIRATVSRPGGQTEVIAAPYLIGADGARSTARRLVGSALAGSFKGEQFLMGDVEADCALDRHSMYMYFSRHAGPLMVFPMVGERMRVIAQIETGEATREPSLPWLQQLVDERAGEIRLTDAHWLTVFEIHHAQVPAYRDGRVFLAGDAAHVHSPAGGQGMNTGLQDAFNLGWKLATASGTDCEALLDSYQAERHPVAARVIEFSTRLTQLATLSNPMATALRNTVLHVATGFARVQHALATQTEETDLAYRDSPVVLSTPRPAGSLRAGDHLCDVPGTELRHWLNQEPGHALITISPAGLNAAPAPGVRQVLITDQPGDWTGFDAILADPERNALKQLDLPESGQVMLRPDSYVGYVADLVDDAFPAYARLTGLA
jgi:2-polyprenyl-6-methoxyphenol hydroxylase-like FAD-dependent oxidoreductase